MIRGGLVGATGSGFMGASNLGSGGVDGVTNIGTLGVRDAAVLTIEAGGVENQGTVLVNSDHAETNATLRVRSENVDVSGEGQVILNGPLPLHAQIDSPTGGSINFGPGQTLSGNGQLVTPIRMEGVIAPGFASSDQTATTEVFRRLTLTSSSMIQIDIDGVGQGQFDSLPGSGQWSLAGELAVAIADDYAAEVGDTFGIIEADSLDGAFDTLNLPDLGANRVMRLVLRADRAELVVTCPADLTGSTNPKSDEFGVPDFRVDAEDFFFFLDAFATDSLDVCDINDDLTCDAEDFFAFLDQFAFGCP